MNVLIIDDENIVRLALRRAFEKRGHVVADAERAEEGKRLWLNQSPDLVLLDVLMPGQSGLQLLEEIRKSNYAIVVLMSAYSGAHGFDDITAVGADIFVKKPFTDVFELVKNCERIVDDRNKDKKS